MNYSDFRFTLDIQIHQAQVSIPVTFGDSARRLCIGLTDGRKPYVIGEGCIAVFSAKKPDGTHLKNACIIERNAIIYEFTEQTTNAEGVVKCDITLYDAYGKVLTTPQFIIVVDKRVVNNEEIKLSADEETALDEIFSNEAQRQEAEGLRQIAFEANENARQSTFEKNEATRQEAENTRQSNENERISNENSRKSNEEQRRLKENARIQNENERIQGEEDRIEAESVRLNSEDRRSEHEDGRMAMENERNKNEETRQKNESLREEGELTRQINENNRMSKDAERDGKIAGIETLVGEIDVALDSIISMQESLIGGES